MMNAISTALTDVIGWVGEVVTALVGETGQLKDLLPLMAIGIGISALSVDGASGEDHVVAGFDRQILLRAIQCVVEHHIHIGEFLRKYRRHAPAQAQFAPNLGVGSHADDIHGTAEAADQPGSLTGHGANNDTLGIHINGHGAGGMG